MGVAPRRFQILALSGGGYRGLFGAEFLAACEAHFQAKCAERFDIIAGTSIGALLAAGLSVGVPAQTLAAAMKEYGPSIFAKGPATGIRRLFVSAPYSPAPIREAVRKTLGKSVATMPLNEFPAPLLITAVNYSTSETTIFRSKGLAGRAASSASVEDAILASAAAPTFFPTKKIAANEYIDGGLVANAPDMIALTDGLNLSGARIDEIYQLSIGTASRRQGAAVHETSRAPGSISWIARRGLIQTIMAAQEHLALSQVQGLLRTRLERVDEEPAQHQVKAIKSLDRASAEATETLRLLAEKAWEARKSSRELRNFFLR
ncbi:hypothetical protein GR212_32655 [Rhizobium lusitanum]|uniref:PNPLA domain-containing protein n=1 Tax=Rhizobium lusitanum TaxID=293958 RepID=A0A6L9UIA6_9HYPH|nr:CBASS cGAMP-activated phospholipase [Rhizobium lusitanum]NEI74308.1 hypothetical protein [Rhizobium lusitanum]